MTNIKLTLNYGYSKIEFSKNNKFYRLNKPSMMLRSFIGKTKHEEYIKYKNGKLHSIDGPAYWCVACNIEKYCFEGELYTKQEWKSLVESNDKYKIY